MKKNSKISSDILKKSEKAAEQKRRKRFTNRYFLLALILAIAITIRGVIDHENAKHLFDVVTKYGAVVLLIWVILIYSIPFKPTQKQNVKLN